MRETERLEDNNGQRVTKLDVFGEREKKMYI